MSQMQIAFDYSQLAPDVRTDVQESARRIHELERRTSESIIEIGQHLIRVKTRLPHGEFLPWLDAEFGWTRITAYNFMKVADTFSNVQNLNIYQPSALYALASNNVPEDVRDDFAAVAEAGVKVTHKDVKDALTDYREREQHSTQAPQLIDAEYRDIDEDTGEILSDEPAPVVLGESAIIPPVESPLSSVHVSHNSGQNEWYTPSHYIDAARDVMGGIDLDPASNDVSNEWIQASTFYTKHDNGLAKDWSGRVWMNPPYAQPLIQQFCEKIVASYVDGSVPEAIVLVNNATETRSFQCMAFECAAICFPKGRIRYLDESGKPANTPLQGQAFLYFGDRPERFVDVFQKFGAVGKWVVE